ncbi:MAG: 3'-5' exonuclease [Lachnospiraceae bacterium]|nr:3'-5' exonuclease [Lachnospiraceae bacterium]
MIQDFTALDIETTGLDPKLDKIIEVAAVKVRSGQIVEEYQSLVSPGRRLTEKITDLTGITDDMLLHAPMPERVIEELLCFIGRDVLLGHSILFDYSFVKRAAVDLGKLRGENYDFDKMQGLDTLKLARIYLPELESRSLPYLCKHFEIPQRAHRAMEDVKATVALYEKLTEKFYQEENFQPFPLVYQVKRQSPASKAQKERLYKLIDKHKLILDEDIDRLTRNEASRLTDKIILKYGR